MAQIQKEYVENKHWITDEELLDFTSVGRSLPGLMIGNTSWLFGYHTAGLPGAIAALMGITIPPVLIMVAVTFVYGLVKDNPLVARAMMGVRAAVVPIIISALMKLFKAGMKDLFCYVVALCAMLLCLSGVMNNVWIVLIGASAGIIYKEVRARNGLH